MTTPASGITVMVSIGLAVAIASISNALSHESMGQSSPVYDVVCIKPSAPLPPGEGGASIHRLPGGRFRAVNATVQSLIRIAYQLQDFQISGGPDWMNSTTFDVEATPDRPFSFENPATDPTFRMLQMLLEQKFQLKLHREHKDMQIYELVVAKNGPKLDEAK